MFVEFSAAGAESGRRGLGDANAAALVDFCNLCERTPTPLEAFCRFQSSKRQKNNLAFIWMLL